MNAIRSQLVRSATSVGANYEESQSASSRKDFINKLHLALKELRETAYWLRLLDDLRQNEKQNHESIQKALNECGQLIKILTSCILTARQNQNKK